MRLFGIVDVLRMLPQHADLEGDLLDLRQRLPAKQPPRIQQRESRRSSWPLGLEFAGRHLAQPIPGQADGKQGHGAADVQGDPGRDLPRSARRIRLHYLNLPNLRGNFPRNPHTYYYNLIQLCFHEFWLSRYKQVSLN